MIDLLVRWICGLAVLFGGPNAHVKAPTTRYHGYELNRLAIQRAKMFTVLISNEGFGGVSRGSGVLIDESHVLTCAHVALGGNEETWVYIWPSHIYFKAHVVTASRADDLAILEIDGLVHGLPEPVFQESHYDGEPITIMGNILGSMKWFVGYGIVSGENARDLYTDGLVRGGDSGGPWINEAGEIVALSDWGLESRGGDALGISGGISARTINRFLKDWKSPTILQILIGG